VSWALLPHPARRGATLDERTEASAVYARLEALAQGFPEQSDDEGAYLILARLSRAAS
jgi:hypothetical protein